MLKYLVFLLVFGKVVVCLPSASLQEGHQHLERRARIKQAPASTGLYGFQRGSVTSHLCEVPQPSPHAIPICSNAATSRLPSTSQTKSPNPATAAVAEPHLRSLRASSTLRAEDSSRAERAGELEQNEDETETSSKDDLISSSSDSGSNKSSSMESSDSSKASDSTPSSRSSDNTTSRDTMSLGPPENVVPMRTSANAPSSENQRNLDLRRGRKKSRFESPKELEHRNRLSSPRWIDAGSASRSPALLSNDLKEFTLRWGRKGIRKSLSRKGDIGKAKSPSSLDDYITESSEFTASSSDDTWASETGKASKRRNMNAKMAENDLKTLKGDRLPVESSVSVARPLNMATPDQLSELESRLRDLGVAQKEYDEHPIEAHVAARLLERFKRNGGSNRKIRQKKKNMKDVAKMIYQRTVWRFHKTVCRWRKKHGITAPNRSKYTPEEVKVIQRVARKMVNLKRKPEIFLQSWSEADQKLVEATFLKDHQRKSFKEQLKLIKAGKPPKIQERRPNGKKKERGSASKPSKSSSKAMEGRSEASLSAER